MKTELSFTKAAILAGAIILSLCGMVLGSEPPALPGIPDAATTDTAAAMQVRLSAVGGVWTYCNPDVANRVADEITSSAMTYQNKFLSLLALRGENFGAIWNAASVGLRRLMIKGVNARLRYEVDRERQRKAADAARHDANIQKMNGWILQLIDNASSISAIAAP